MVNRYYLPAILCSLVILVLTLMPGQAVPKVEIFQVDKLVHFFVFSSLMVSASYGTLKSNQRNGTPGRPFLWSGFYSVIFGIMIEVLQQFIPGRSFSIPDMVANSIGVGLGYLLCVVMQRRNIV